MVDLIVQAELDTEKNYWSLEKGKAQPLANLVNYL